MITFLKGAVVEKQATRVVLDVAGVGYELLIPLSSYDRLPAVGESCRILAYDHVREDTHQLFGFMTEDERRMFVLLMGVSGIGPRTALSVLSGLSVREITAAIAEEDSDRLYSVPGIGRKLAQRIVVELQDRIRKGEALEALAGAPESWSRDARLRDAVSALAALGFRQGEARKMVQRAAQDAEAGLAVEELVKRALGSSRAT